MVQIVMAESKLVLWFHAATAIVVLLCLAKHGGAFLERKAVNCLAEPFRCKDIFEGINSYLQAHIESDDVKENMAVIEDWIERDQSSHSLTKSETSRMSALVLIRDLLTTDGPGRCKGSTGQLLENNDLALRNAITKLEPGKQPRKRLEKIVHHYADAYMRRCDFEPKLARFDKNELKNIRDFIGELIGSHANAEKFFMFKMINPVTFVKEHSESAAKFAKSIQSMGTRSDVEIAHRWLGVIANRNKDPKAKALKRSRLDSGEIFVDTETIYKLFRKHLVTPCENYVYFFETALQNRWTLVQSRKLHKKQGTEAELDKHIAYFHGCTKFIRKEKSIAKGIEYLVQNERGDHSVVYGPRRRL